MYQGGLGGTWVGIWAAKSCVGEAWVQHRDSDGDCVVTFWSALPARLRVAHRVWEPCVCPNGCEG
jgi:hypothetical protein